MTKSLDTPAYESAAPHVSHGAGQLPAPAHLRCNNLSCPLGIDIAVPRLSWQLTDTRRGTRQQAYQVMAASSRMRLDADTPDLWDSGLIESDQSVEVTYAGVALPARTRCWWKVRIIDQNGDLSPWSKPASWEMGLLSPGDWQATWIGSPLHVSDRSGPCPYLRRTFDISQPISHARLYVTARGLFQLELNGQRISNDELTPGWSDYHKRLMYLTYDVTDALKPGANAIGAILGDGWYCGHLLWENRRSHYGQLSSLLLQLEITRADGTRHTISSDEQWRTTTGPIVESDLYNGETYDARSELPGWSTADYDDAAWVPVIRDESATVPLVAKCNEPVRAIQELSPVTLSEPAPGNFVFDFGQNMVGRVRLHVAGPAGTQVTLRFAEMLQSDGTLYTENLRTAKATDRYTLRGGTREVYEPRFTFHGFRYVEITGFPGTPTLDTLKGIVLHSDMPPTGSFECSNPKINRLQQNILWGQKGNFLDVPTDCPQRDERLGWTGDAQVFIRTAAFNMDVSSFFTKWASDMADAQHEDGAFTHIAPDILKVYGSAGWGDAGVICPWITYLCYGQKRILEQNFDSMLRWINYQEKTSKALIRPGMGYGDWLAIDAVEPGRTPTPIELIGTAYFFHTTQLTARIARLLNRNDDAEQLGKLAERIRIAFNREFVTPGGRVVGHSQSGYLMALAYDLLPENQRPVALAHLVQLIEERDWHLSTGFLGTPLLQPVLSRFGRADVAYRLIHQETYPSWLYPITQGATTMWERWNSYTNEKGFGDAGMNSFNHYAFGAVGEWLYATVGGISPDPDRPGYQHAFIQPDPGTTEAGLDWAKTDLQTPYGLLQSHWQVQGNEMTFTVRVPPNTQASIAIPSVSIDATRESDGSLDQSAGLSEVTYNAARGLVMCQASAGLYQFRSKLSGRS